MGKYTQLAKDIIKNVGGKENVISLRHCITRLRFQLKDESIANDEVLKNMDGVMTVVKAAGEYMVVIGEHVPDVFDEVMVQLGRKADEQPAAEEKRGNLLDRALKLVMSSMGPVLNLLCATGIIKGVLVLLTMVGLSTESGVYQLLYAAGDSLFYIMPVIIGFNVAKHLGADPYLGLIFGAALTYPAIQGVDLNLFGWTVNATYSSTFLPAIFGALILAPVYKFFDKRLPAAIKGFLAPMLALLIAFPITFLFVGPVANAIGEGIAFVMDFLFEKAPLLAYTLLGGVWQILVMFGVHGMIVMFSFYALLAGTPSAIVAISGLPCWAILGILIGVILKTKNSSLKQTSTAAAVSAFLGVTEPAMYGIIVPRKILLGISCVAGAAGGFIAGLFQLKTYVYTGMGFMSLLGFLNPDDPHIIPVILVIAVMFGVGMMLTLTVFKDDKAEEETKVVEAEVKESNKQISIVSPVSGSVASVTASSDEAFASEALGKGVVITPDSNEVVAPVSGTVQTLFPTLHAVGIVGDNGEEVLIHIGINTVNLQGKHFEAFVKQGDAVKQGDKLVTFDKEAIEKEGYSTEVMMVITNTNNYLDVIPFEAEKVSANSETVIKLL